jgi:ferritin-like metal-binding protein YciE
MDLNASFRPEQPADFEFAEYKVLVTAAQRVGGKLQASFRVEPNPAEEEKAPG